MLVSQKIVDAFNAQIGRELGASHQYLQIAAYFSHANLEELSKFFFRQGDEEREHAMKFVRFLLDVDGKVAVPQIAEPKASFGAAREAVALSLEWEEEVTRQIYELVELAQSERNYIALRFLDWFVNEQREEVNLMSTLLAVVERAGEDNLLYVEDYISRHGVQAAAPAEPA